MEQRVLLVEDEINIRQGIKLNLELEGLEVDCADNGKTAIKKFTGGRYNLVILDIMLPEVDGLQVCESIRLEDREVPILFLTAKDTTQDKILGLKKGADDYITKPFNIEEFLLRVKVLLKHSLKGTEEDNAFKEFEFGNNKINFATYKAQCQKGEINLTKKETKLLKLLVERANEVVSREHILQFVWGYDVFPSTRTIDNFILSFRKYFEENPREPKFFHSIRGVGYKFVI